LYAMIGIGLTVVFGVMRISNLAHGEMVMLGMFGAFWGQKLWKLDPFVSLLVWTPLMFVAGVLLYRRLPDDLPLLRRDGPAVRDRHRGSTGHRVRTGHPHHRDARALPVADES